MQLIRQDQLLVIMPGARAVVAAFLDPLTNAMFEFGIASELRVEHFIAQIAHESQQLQKMQEGMNYSAKRLMEVWPSRFPTLAVANAYAGRPEAIANKVYANRMGNGNEASSDGWRHRGAGLIALTGADNQSRCAKYFGISPAEIGDWLRTPEGACRAAAWFWREAGCNEMADRNDLDAISDAINIGHQTAKKGDAVGFNDRLAFLTVAQRVIT